MGTTGSKNTNEKSLPSIPQSLQSGHSGVHSSSESVALAETIAPKFSKEELSALRLSFASMLANDPKTEKHARSFSKTTVVSKDAFLSKFVLPPHLPTFGDLLYRSFLRITYLLSGEVQQDLTFAVLLDAISVFTGTINVTFGELNLDRVIYESFAEKGDTDDDDGDGPVKRTHARKGTNKTLDLEDLFTPAPVGPLVLATDLLIILQGLAWCARKHMQTVQEDIAEAESTAGDKGKQSSDKRDQDDIAWEKIRMLDVVHAQLRFMQNPNGTVTSSPPSSIPEIDTATINARDFEQWQNRNAPNLFRILSAYIKGTLCAKPPTVDPYAEMYAIKATRKDIPATLLADPQRVLFPDFTEFMNSSNILSRYVDCWMLSWFLPEKSTKGIRWELLFNAAEHGWALNRVETHAFKYPGPTLLLLKVDCTASTGSSTSCIPNTLGAYVPIQWQRSKNCWGTDEALLFDMSDPRPKSEKGTDAEVKKENPGGCFEVLPAVKRNDRYVFYNPKSGFAFGGGLKEHTARLEMDAGLVTGEWRCDSFQEVPPTYGFSSKGNYVREFEMVDMEIWGLGGVSARSQQKREQQFEEKDAEWRSKINVRQGDGVNRAILEMAGLLEAESLGVQRTAPEPE